MSGLRTIIANLVALLSAALLLCGIDLGEELRAVGLEPASIVDQVTGGVNLVISIAAALAGIYFRLRATKVYEKPGDPLDDGPALHCPPVVVGLAVAIALASLAGCGQTLTRTPDARDSLAIAYGLHATVTHSAAQLLDARVISLDTAKQVRDQAAVAKATLDTAMALMTAPTPNTSEAMQRIAAAQTLLTSLRQELDRYGSVRPQGP